MSEIDDLKRRVEALERFHSEFSAEDMRQLARDAKGSAQFNALRSIVEELAHHEGIPLSEVQQHYEIRIRYFHALNLESTEDISPRLATQIDTRATSDPEPDDEFPPLFPDDSQSGT